MQVWQFAQDCMQYVCAFVLTAGDQTVAPSKEKVSFCLVPSVNLHCVHDMFSTLRLYSMLHVFVRSRRLCVQRNCAAAGVVSQRAAQLSF